MAFNFGSVRQTEKRGTNLQKVDAMLREHYVPGHNYYLFLVDNVLQKAYLDLLSKDIEKVGIISYNIVSVVSAKLEDDSTEMLLSMESTWRDYVTFNDQKCHCIMAFGAAVRAINKSADITFYDFLDDKFNEPRYWLSYEFVNGPDCFIYPTAPVENLYPLSVGIDPTTYLTRWFRNILKRMQQDDMDPNNSLDMRPYGMICADGREETLKILNSYIDTDLMAIDTETDSLDSTRGNIGTVQLCKDGQIAHVLEWKYIDKRVLKKVLTTAKRIVGVNSKFDEKFLWNNGVRDWHCTDDAMLLSHALNSNRPKGLKAGAFFYTMLGGYDYSLDITKKKLHVENYLQIPKNVLYKYAAIDVIVTIRYLQALEKQVRYIDKKYPNEKLPGFTIERWYKEVMMPNAQVVTEVEIEGVHFNPKQFDKSEEAIKEKIAGFKKELSELWNVPINFKFESTKELGQLFKRMGWPQIELSKAGDFKTSDQVLDEYERLKKPGIKTLKNLRSYTVALKTFIDGWRPFLRQYPDGSWRIHPNCSVFGTETYRHAPKEPNFAQIPASSVMASHIKRLFYVPPNVEEPDDLVGDHTEKDWLIVSGDFRGLQAQLSASDCGINRNGISPVMYDLFGKDGTSDMHSQTAWGTFCDPVGLEIIEVIDDETGEKIIFGEEQRIKIKRKGLIDDDEEIIIKGKEFSATDEFISYV